MLSDKGSFIISASSTPTSTDTEFHPSKFNYSFESLADENSGRTDNGEMHINWIYQRIRKFEIAMPPMKATEAALLLSKVQGQVYYITYWDLLTATEKTAKVYTSTSSADCYSGVLYGGLWQNISFNAIELEGENYDLAPETATIYLSSEYIDVEVDDTNEE